MNYYYCKLQTIEEATARLTYKFQVEQRYQRVSL